MHFTQNESPGSVIANLAERHHWKVSLIGAQQLRDIVRHDMQFAVIAHVYQAAQSAFVAAQRVISVESKKYAGAEAAHPYELSKRRVLVDSQNAHAAS